MKTAAAVLAIAMVPGSVSGLARASDAMPADLVGIWATSESTFRGDALASGTALYIAANGRVEEVSGPPPIGVKFEMTFDATTSTLRVTRLFNPTAHGWEAVPSQPGWTMAFDARKLVLSPADRPGSLHRRVAGLSPAVLQMAGLDCEPLDCPIP